MSGLLDWLLGRRADEPFPEAWRAIVDRDVPLVARLTPEQRARLERLTARFLRRVAFESPKHLALTDVHKLVIATQACLLLVGREEVKDPYPDLGTVVVYPSAFVSTMSRRNPDYTVTEERIVRSGESWGLGTVVLSWEDTADGTRDADDGQNVVLHEFAHQLDSENGPEDGAPQLRPDQFGPWAKVLGETYDALVRDIARGRRTLLGGYAATSPAEFFAVATERFFEQPDDLRRDHPALFEQLVEFYGFEPADEPR